jgi:chromosome partitioning protein
MAAASCQFATSISRNKRFAGGTGMITLFWPISPFGRASRGSRARPVSTIVAIANHKGGVGKSTSSMMIAEGLALFHGRRVLLLDLDQQGMLSRMMMSQSALDAAARERRTSADMIRAYTAGQQGALPYLIMPQVSDIAELRNARDGRRVDLVPSHPQSLREYRLTEEALAAQSSGNRPDQALALMMQPDLQRLAAYYDVIMFDCAAGVSTLSLAALRLSNIVVSPTMLERNSINALVDFLRIILEADLGFRKNTAQQVFVLMTMFMRSNPAQQLLLDTIQRGIPGLNAFPTAISHSTAIQRAVLHPGEGASRLAHEKYGSAIGELQQLASAVDRVIGAQQLPQLRPALRQHS